jgi:hypothetical protein
MVRRVAPALTCAALACGTAPAAADEAAPPRKPAVRAIDPAEVGGVERPAREEQDAQLEAASWALFLPRQFVKLSFAASGLAAGLIRDEQVVPRVEELLDPSPGNISVIPMLFLDTRRRTSVGAQMLASGKDSATKLAVGFGGIHDMIGEARIRYGFKWPVPIAITVEGLTDTRSALDYLGVGQEPEKDARNRFRKDASTREATYYERRVRAIAGVGVRAASSFEIFASASVTRSRVEDTPDGGAATLSRVFVPGSVIGAPRIGETSAESHVLYAELALRFDTRPTRARPSPGYLIEMYGGAAEGTGDDATRFYRMGGRVAAFFPILRPTNILSPKLVLDGMFVPAGARVPFTSLVSQPDFRGIDNRLDNVSLVASLDYRWSFNPYVGARLFVDMATVGSDVGVMLDASKRVAAGFGVDVFSKSTELAQMTVSFSSEGARAYFTFGVPSLFGDRQHRR